MCSKESKLRRCIGVIHGYLFWNFFITTSLELALEKAIHASIRLYVINYDTWWEGTSSGYAISELVFMALFAIFAPVFLYYKRDVLDTDAFKKRFGAMIDSMDTRRAGPRFHISLFFIRRLIFAAVIVFLPRYPWAQMLIICWQSMIQSVFIAYVKPFELSWRNNLDQANEYLVLLTTYFVFIYSDGMLLVEKLGQFVKDEEL